MPRSEKSNISESSRLLDKQRKASASRGNGARKQSRRVSEEVSRKTKHDVGMQRFVVSLTTGQYNIYKKSDLSHRRFIICFSQQHGKVSKCYDIDGRHPYAGYVIVFFSMLLLAAKIA